MLSVPRTVRVGLVAALTAGAMGAGVLALATGPAVAAGGATTDLALSSDQTVSAGTCAVYTLTPIAADRTMPSDSATITIRLSETGNAAQQNTQDVDFCSVTGETDAPSTNPFYENGQLDTDPMHQDPMDPGSARQRPTYTAGASITPDVNGLTGQGASPSAADRPDTASNTDYPATGPAANTNPSGMDYAQFKYVAGRPIHFGVAGLQSGTTANILAWRAAVLDDDAPPTPAAGELTAPTGHVSFTNGGLPGSSAAADAVTRLEAEPEDASAPIGTLQVFTAQLFNASGQTVAGVRPLITVVTGPNSTSARQVRADCGLSDNKGVSNCAWQTTGAGTDTLKVFVNRSGGSAGADANEAFDDIIRTTVGPTNSNPAAARFVDLTPDAATSTAGISRDFTAIVTDVDGNPVQGAVVTFSETGPGSLTATSAATGSNGRASVTATSTATESGTQTITATLPSTSQCAQPAGTPAGSAAGRCTDSATHVITKPGASPSATPSATPTSTVTPTPGGCRVVSVRVNTATINATGRASVTLTGARPGSSVELQGYSQNHFGTANFDNDTTPRDRVGTADSNGSVTFNDLRPASNTRVRARMVGCPYGNSAVIEVRAQETLLVKRNSTRNYTFSGRSIPARPGGLIVSLYRIVGSPCAAGVEPSRCPGERFVSQARAVALGSPGEGLYSIRISFRAADQNVRDEFVVKTGRDAQNAPGRSNSRSLLIY